MKGELILNNIIAISGVKDSGKDTAAEMLQYCLSVPKILRQYCLFKWFKKIVPKKYKIIAFATPLKQMLSILLNVPRKRFNDRDFKENYAVNLSSLEVFKIKDFPERIILSDSKFNKLIRTERLIEYNITIRQLMQYFGTSACQDYFGRRVWINSTLNRSNQKLIISDLRFIEEYNAVKEKNGFIIFITRPNRTFGQHASEREMEYLLTENKYDRVIYNNNSLKKLFNSIKCITNV